MYLCIIVLMCIYMISRMYIHICVLCLVAQSCLTLYDPMYCSPPGSSTHEDSPGKNTRVGCHALLQGIFPTQELNLGLPHCRQILYHPSHQGSPCTHIGVYINVYTHNNRNKALGSQITHQFDY